MSNCMSIIIILKYILYRIYSTYILQSFAQIYLTLKIYKPFPLTKSIEVEFYIYSIIQNDYYYF